jgi:hypothetical protein
MRNLAIEASARQDPMSVQMMPNGSYRILTLDDLVTSNTTPEQEDIEDQT